METPHIIRATTPVDWSVVAGMLDQYLDWIDRHVPVPIPDDVRRLADAERRSPAEHFGPPHRLLIVSIGILPAGILGARRSGATAELTRFFLRPFARGTGAARLLIRSMLDALAADGVERVVLDTMPSSMPAAYRIYEDIGFVVAETDVLAPGSVRMELALTRSRPALAAVS
jgi:GNAT superfamily N-acetyltransferase